MIWKILLVIYGIVIAVFAILTIIDSMQGYGVNITPKDFYESTNVNIFGAYFLFFLMLSLNPLFYVYKFLWWLFHFGRKD